MKHTPEQADEVKQFLNMVVSRSRHLADAIDTDRTYEDSVANRLTGIAIKARELWSDLHEGEKEYQHDVGGRSRKQRQKEAQRKADAEASVKMFVSKENIEKLRKVAKVSIPELSDDKSLLDFCKGALQNFEIKELKLLTVDEWEKVMNMLDTRTGEQRFVPLKEREAGDHESRLARESEARKKAAKRRREAEENATSTQDDQLPAPTSS